MESNGFAALLDTNALFGTLQRNILLSLAAAGLYHPYWTRDILNELEGCLTTQRDNVNARCQCGRIEAAFPETEISGYEEMAEALTLPGLEDRHVLTTASMCGAQLIVTDTLKDFPKNALTTYDIEALNVDQFIANTIDLSPVIAIAALRVMREKLKRPEITAARLIEIAEARGLTKTALLMDTYREHLRPVSPSRIYIKSWLAERG